MGNNTTLPATARNGFETSHTAPADRRTEIRLTEAAHGKQGGVLQSRPDSEPALIVPTSLRQPGSFAPQW